MDVDTVVNFAADSRLTLIPNVLMTLKRPVLIIFNLTL